MLNLIFQKVIVNMFFSPFSIAEGFQPDIVTYNSILKIAGTVREDGEFIIQLIDVRISLELHDFIIFNFKKYSFSAQETLMNMAHAGIKPNVRSLNATLQSVSRIPISRVAREKALKLMSDFKSIGVNPSLGTYFFLLKIFCRESKSQKFTVGFSGALFIQFLSNRGANE
jgi:pentatricopeptide repeat domain-containing protein 3